MVASGETSRDAQTKQNATTVESAASDYLGDQGGAEVLMSKTISVFGVSNIERTISTKRPEDYISEAYSEVYSTSVTGQRGQFYFVATQ